MTDPVGEESWIAFVDEASRSARDLEQRIQVLEQYKRALGEEPCSLGLWSAYCEYVWSLHTDCQSGDAGWSEEEQMLGQEIFSLKMAKETWERAAHATRYRLKDSHHLWNRWIGIEQEGLLQSRDRQQIDRVRILFVQRLQIPHSTWDDTSSMFSQFMTKYDEANWEDVMVHTNRLAKHAKDEYSAREIFENKLEKAVESESKESQETILKEYLEWETSAAKKKNGNWNLCFTLYERALLLLSMDVSLWEDYATLITTHLILIGRKTQQEAASEVPDLLHTLSRATKHCPWSGSLWSRYILKAELDGLQHEQIEQIKHAATDGPLGRDSMDDVIAVHVAWCGYLRRKALSESATEDDIDIADVGLVSAIESVRETGRRLYGEGKFQGDSTFRLERAHIQYLTQKGAIDEARTEWNKLSKSHGTFYEFWQRFYLWEMTVNVTDPRKSLATRVLRQAINQHNLDWPEKILENYVLHCESHENAFTLANAVDTAYRTAKGVAKRRQEESLAAAEAYAQQQQPQSVQAAEAAEPIDTSSPSVQKRKREEEADEENKSAKKVKGEAVQDEQHLKRDRENTTVLVTNLPIDVTMTKTRQYFKEYGHVNNLFLRKESNGQSTAALIEFRSPEDAKSALLRNGKYFGSNQLAVESGTGLTIYVTNYPPIADEAYITKLFEDCGEIFNIRFPSLKFNTHRRFCYVSFRTAAAASAATELNGKMIEGRFKLVAMYSDPGKKKPRDEAVTDGREVHISNIDLTATEDEVREIFAKYGVVENVKILKNMAGRSKGSGFVVFDSKDSATESLKLDKTKFKSEILAVEIAVAKNFKPISTSGLDRGSPAPSSTSMADGASPAASAEHSGPTRDEIAERSIALMNLPDTVNDARVRELAQAYGTITKLILRPDHQGAVIEYSDVASAGKASLGLEGHEIPPGRKLRTGNFKELFAQKGEYRSDKIKVGSAATTLKPTAAVRRPGPNRNVGPKRGLGFVGAVKKDEKKGNRDSNGTASEVVEEGQKVKKSNADFKAMFFNGS